MRFIFVQYHKKKYPEDITPDLVEVAGHFDKDKIDDVENYSLHTEYSYGKRKFSTKLIKNYPELCESNKKEIPQLWKSKKWAEEFAYFVFDLTQNHTAPKVIEIHPPFNDYCNLEQFIERYSTFEKIIHDRYPNTEIVIENRAGSRYSGGRFIICQAEEIASLCKIILETKTRLGVVLDFPQLLTAENINTESFDCANYYKAIENIYPYQNVIKGIHVWGKKKNAKGNWVAHSGTLDTYFSNPEDKNAFLKGICKICSDNQKRFFVPEVNSNASDLESIVKDVLA